MMKLSKADPFDQTLLVPLRAQAGPKKRPEGQWLYSTGGRPHEPTTDPLAQQVVALWRPTQPTKVEAIRPGWAGTASYRLPYADGDKHLKIAMARPQEEAANYEDVRKGAMGEAERARWAGARGLGPEVHFTHAPLGAFVCDFVDGRVPSLDESRGPLLQANLQALAQLHRQDLEQLPEGGQLNWLNEGPRVCADLDAADAPARPAAFRHALLQIEAGLEHYRTRAPFVPVPIHDDYKPDNTLLADDRLFLLDWNNLRAADAAIDLGHFAVMVDLSAEQVATSYVDRYLAIQQQSGAPADDGQLRTATKAYTGLFRLRNAAFYDQWAGSRPKSEYLINRLVSDVDAMRRDVFRELDLRPIAFENVL